jgi:hypothetical protein
MCEFSIFPLRFFPLRFFPLQISRSSLSKANLLKSSDHQLQVARQISKSNRKAYGRSVPRLPELPNTLAAMPYDKTLISELKKSRKFNESVEDNDEENEKKIYFSKGEKHIVMKK